MRTRAVGCSGLHEPWTVEAVDIDPSGPHEVVVQMAPERGDPQLFNTAMFNQWLLGTVFGSCSPRVQIPNLVTQEYTLDEVQNGYDELAAGTNVRGVVRFDL